QADAKTANLWGKAGPWTQYPKRMLQMRARGFGCRDCFPDLLRGIIIKEEAEDMPRQKTDYSRAVGVTLDNEPEQIQLINDDQIHELKAIALELGANLNKTCDHLNIKAIEDMSSSQWAEVMRQFEKKLIIKRKTENLPINMHVQETMTDGAKEFFGDEDE